jgi:hypothetical protein
MPKRRIKTIEEREKKRAQNKANYAANAEKRRAKARKNYADNPKKYRARQRADYAVNHEKRMAKQRDDYAANPEKYCIKSSNYYYKNREKVIEKNINRRAIKKMRTQPIASNPIPVQNENSYLDAVAVSDPPPIWNNNYQNPISYNSLLLFGSSRQPTLSGQASQGEQDDFDIDAFFADDNEPVALNSVADVNSFLPGQASQGEQEDFDVDAFFADIDEPVALNAPSSATLRGNTFTLFPSHDLTSSTNTNSNSNSDESVRKKMSISNLLND